jgi:threonine dehydratase
VVRTPLHRSEWLSRDIGAETFLKLETLQPTSSYKIRGAWNAALAMKDRGDDRALVTASAGNHGRALAYAARSEGMPLRVYVPRSAPQAKLEGIRTLGAEVRLTSDYDEAERSAKDDAGRSGAVFISPYSHSDVIAGAGTIALEILEDCPDLSVVIASVGGGGLVSGLATALESTDARVIGIEAEASCPFTQSLKAGRIVPIDVAPSIADGLVGNLDPDASTFDIVKRLVADIDVVSEDEILAALRSLVREDHLIAEGAAAVAIAGARRRRFPPSSDSPQKIVVILSGANIDAEVLRRII